jgi:Amt family ammonium transporter
LYPWAAIILGAIAGASLIGWHKLMLALKIDDPLDAVAVHLGGGLTGILLTPIFAINGKLGVGGIIFSGHELAFKSFAWNLCGAVVIMCWVATTSLLLFGTLKLTGFLRVPELVEIAGLDGFHHGELAYPLSSYANSELPNVAGSKAGVENGALQTEDEV